MQLVHFDINSNENCQYPKKIYIHTYNARKFKTSIQRRLIRVNLFPAAVYLVIRSDDYVNNKVKTVSIFITAEL